MSEETSSEFLLRLGFDGRKWAEAFVKQYPDIPLDIAVAWFCNAIMTGYDYAYQKEAQDAKQEVME